ncbi:MAG: DUF971 domain-containing protein [Pseudomonadota bacterium]
MTDENTPWPTEIRVDRQAKCLRITFDNDDSFTLPAELLRVESPSAEVQGHGPSQKVTIAGRRHVGIMDVEPVGNYAIKIKFDDLHDTGIFTFAYLHQLGQHQDEVWRAYLDALEAQGLTRDP